MNSFAKLVEKHFERCRGVWGENRECLIFFVFNSGFRLTGAAVAPSWLPLLLFSVVFIQTKLSSSTLGFSDYFVTYLLYLVLSVFALSASFVYRVKLLNISYIGRIVLLNFSSFFRIERYKARVFI